MLNRFFTSGKIAVAAILASIVIISDFSNLFAQELRFLGSPALIRFDLHPLGINHEIDDIASELGILRSTANIAFIIYRVQVQNIGSQLTPLYAQALLRDRSGRIIRYSGVTQGPFESIGPSQIVSLEFGIAHGDFRNHNQLGYEPPSGSLSDILGGAIILLLKNEPHGSVLNDLSVTIPDITNLELEPALIRVALLRNAVIRPFINFSNNERYQIQGDRLNWSFSNPNLIYFPGFREGVPEILTLGPGNLSINVRLNDSLWEFCCVGLSGRPDDLSANILVRFSRIGNRLLNLSASATLQVIEGSEIETAPRNNAKLLNFVANGNTFTTNDRLNLRLEMVRTEFDEPVDLYIAVVLPSDDILFFNNDPFFPFNFEPIAYRSNINFVDYERINILDFSVNANLRGIYTFMTAFMRSNQPVSPANVVGEIVSLEIGIN